MGSILSICTATYNRAYILPKLFLSLKEQSSKQFEWIVIDDNSSDNTIDLVKQWIRETRDFEIRYYKQPHGGKHRAINKAVEMARGDFVFIVDSDDRVLPNAVALIHQWINTCKDNDKIAAVAGLRINAKGDVWGGSPKIQKSFIDASNFERAKYRLEGDKAEVYRRDLLERFRFPEFENEFFVTEDVCWLNIAAAGYKIRWFNQPLYITEYLDDGLTKTGSNEYLGHKNNFKGYCFYINECVKKKPFIDKMVHFSEFEKTCSSMKIGILDRAKYLHVSMLHYLTMRVVGVPIGYVGLILRKIKNKFCFLPGGDIL